MHARLLLAALLAATLGVPAGARTPAEHWPDYEIILWQRQSDAAYATLPRLGYSGAVVFGRHAGVDAAEARHDAVPLRAAGLRWYVENIATDFYSAYHRWEGHDRPVNARFLDLQRRYRENPRDPALLLREPSLSDTDWLARIRDRLAAHARVHAALAAPGRPLFLNLGDEPGIADLSAAWDFDWSPPALAGFRDWLRAEYGTLDALNAQWGAGFASWDAVLPETTDAALARGDGNHSSWSDMKAWMDLAFARAVAAGRDAVAATDPALLAGIAGGQAPGWGGWNYALLPHAVDVLETNDLGGNVAVAQGFNPGLVTLSTSFRADAREWHRLWRQVMRGMRGTIVWEEGDAVVAADGTPGPRGLASAERFAALRAGIPAQLLASEVEVGAVGILYAQQDFRLRWLLDRRADWQRDGASWAARGAEREHVEENAWRAALRRSLRALAQQGVTPRWLTPAMLAAGVPAALRVLILPHALALGDAEAAAVRDFAARGGVVVADAAEPGAFDARGRRRDQPALVGLPLQRPEILLRDPADAEAAPHQAFAALLRDAGAAAPDLHFDGPAVEMRSWRNGAVRLIGVQREVGADRLPVAQPGMATLALAAPVHARLLGGAPGMARAQRVAVQLDAVLPRVLVLSPAPLPKPVMEGEAPAFRFFLDGPSPAAAHVLRVELLDPEGAARPDRGWNLVLRGGAPADWSLPVGAANRPGTWTLRVTDLLGGERVERVLELRP